MYGTTEMQEGLTRVMKETEVGSRKLYKRFMVKCKKIHAENACVYLSIFHKKTQEVYVALWRIVEYAGIYMYSWNVQGVHF